jgi:hypothetical protein
MTVRVAVIENLVSIEEESGWTHRVFERIRVVDGALDERIVCKRNSGAILDERRRLLSLGIGDEICRAELILFSPPAPVRNLAKQLVELGRIPRKPRRRRRSILSRSPLSHGRRDQDRREQRSN